MKAKKYNRNPKYIISISGQNTVLAYSNEGFCRSISQVTHRKIDSVHSAFKAISENNRNPEKEFMIKVHKKYQYHIVQ